MKDYIVNIQQCIFIYVHSKLYWVSVGRLPKVPSLSTLFFSPFLSLSSVFVEGAKLCSVWAGGSTRGERTFPQAPGRAEQGVQEKCPWGESSTPLHYSLNSSFCSSSLQQVLTVCFAAAAQAPACTFLYRELFISFVKICISVFINGAEQAKNKKSGLTPPHPPFAVAQLICKCWGLVVMLAFGWVWWGTRRLIYKNTPLPPPLKSK